MYSQISAKINIKLFEVLSYYQKNYHRKRIATLQQRNVFQKHLKEYLGFSVSRHISVSSHIEVQTIFSLSPCCLCQTMPWQNAHIFSKHSRSTIFQNPALNGSNVAPTIGIRIVSKELFTKASWFRKRRSSFQISQRIGKCFRSSQNSSDVRI